MKPEKGEIRAKAQATLDAGRGISVRKAAVDFARKNTMTAVYLPVEVVSGAASSLNLTGVFTKGGWLEFIATWSSDAGDGIDDRIVFVTNQGEAAVYSGSFADASNISFVGRFDIGSPPLGKNAFLSVGGDLIIMTQAGWIPMSQVVGNDETRLSSVSVTAKIETLWRKMVNDRGSVPWQAIRWPACGDGSRWKYHHGRPLIAGTTIAAIPSRSAAAAIASTPATGRSVPSNATSPTNR